LSSTRVFEEEYGTIEEIESAEEETHQERAGENQKAVDEGRSAGASARLEGNGEGHGGTTEGT